MVQPLSEEDAARKLMMIVISLLSPKDDDFVEKLVKALDTDGIRPRDQCGTLACLIVNGVDHGNWPHVLEKMNVDAQVATEAGLIIK